jgi:hypothetical protein
MTEQNDLNVNLNEFASMVGFPVELIKKELFESGSSKDKNQEDISMDELRQVMLKYLDKTMA